MASLDQSVPFFTLPIELREQIYKGVLVSPSQGTDLLRTCHEIKAEAHKFLFQRPLRFASQQALFNWIHQAPSSLLHYVKDICLEVRIADQRSIMSRDIPLAGSDYVARLRTTDLYEEDLAKLKEALQRLPNIQKITVCALTTSQDALYREFLAKVLVMLTSLYPALEELRLDGNMHRQSLAYLASLRQLKAFSFDGISSTTSSETGKILASLENLSSLSLVSQHGISPPDSPVLAYSGTKVLSFNGEVVRTMNQLASFSVIEHKPATAPTLFFTSDILAALRHHQKLQNLSVSLSHVPGHETLEALQDFLELSNISHLELDWPGLVPQILKDHRLVRDNLQVLWIRAQRIYDAFHIVDSVRQSRAAGDVPDLRQVVLLRSSDAYGSAEQVRATQGYMFVVAYLTYLMKGSALDPFIDEAKFQEVRGQLQRLGVQVGWCTED